MYKKESWLLFIFLCNCALLFNSRSSIFVHEMLFFSHMLMKIFSNMKEWSILVDCSRSVTVGLLKREQTNTSLASCCEVLDTVCYRDVDTREPLIAWYLFFMMPDGAPADLITLVWHINKHICLCNVTTGMLRSQQWRSDSVECRVITYSSWFTKPDSTQAGWLFGTQTAPCNEQSWWSFSLSLCFYILEPQCVAFCMNN